MTLWIPPLWEKDWDGAIRNSDGAESVLLKSQAFAVDLLRRINNPKVTFARLAWLHMWTKAFATLEPSAASLTEIVPLVRRINSVSRFRSVFPNPASVCMVYSE